MMSSTTLSAIPRCLSLTPQFSANQREFSLPDFLSLRMLLMGLFPASSRWTEDMHLSLVHPAVFFISLSVTLIDFSSGWWVRESDFIQGVLRSFTDVRFITGFNCHLMRTLHFWEGEDFCFSYFMTSNYFLLQERCMLNQVMKPRALAQKKEKTHQNHQR